MQYGHFDDAHKEYVITRPDTPRPWSNYLGSLEYGAIITNNAGGYSFYKSALSSRFLRLRSNAVPMDQPGRYFYLRDASDGDYWSTSWQPVGKSLDTYESECRHGTAYTQINSRYRNVRMESTYFVPLDQAFEYWMLTVTNEGKTARDLDLFTYCEFASPWHMPNDLRLSGELFETMKQAFRTRRNFAMRLHAALLAATADDPCADFDPAAIQIRFNTA